MTRQNKKPRYTVLKSPIKKELLGRSRERRFNTKTAWTTWLAGKKTLQPPPRSAPPNQQPLPGPPGTPNASPAGHSSCESRRWEGPLLDAPVLSQVVLHRVGHTQVQVGQASAELLVPEEKCQCSTWSPGPSTTTHHQLAQDSTPSDIKEAAELGSLKSGHWQGAFPVFSLSSTTYTIISFTPFFKSDSFSA